MTSARFVFPCLVALCLPALGCTVGASAPDTGAALPDAGRDAAAGHADAGREAGTADAGRDAGTALPDAGHDAATTIADSGRDAATVDSAAGDAATLPDAGHDAAPDDAPDSGCATGVPVCMPLPSNCHYDSSLDPCRCGMVVCDPYPACSPPCGSGEFCEFHVGDCGSTGLGTCNVRPGVCSALFHPVCGCDGHTYTNACHAQGAGQSIVYDGACETPTDCRTAGCAGGQTCMPCRGAGYVCLDDGTVC
jgi:hypothetical protein